MYKNLFFPRSSLNILLFFALTITSSCASKFVFNTSEVVPAAEGSVKVKKDKNNNYKIDLHVKNLADPKKLTPPKEMYIVWMETEQSGTKNIGQLKTSKGIFSSKLNSSLSTVTAFHPRTFFITAEDESTTQFPDGEKILRTGTAR